eukprot:TRINITY_DN25499_c0_g3_i2.p1 TRINITY_DN25499_c0_g3~~TRINITY_DN25499_c0_g3_i2.p1  ORF type:complete len:603 (+),score=140.45 TRINITY_DN25499_c0_g3_i2:117-1925(+)
MGYLVQITNEVGKIIFQVAKNYPDVSFASSMLLHALVTASLKQGFVPGVVRTQDASVGLAVHGPAGSRLTFALVTSEASLGQTADVEARLHWRLQIIYRAALMAAGGELLQRAGVSAQPEALQRLLSQRLAPVVEHLMVEEEAEGLAGRVPRLGLTFCGAAVEWLARMAVAESCLESLLSKLPAQRKGQGERVATISWQGRVLAATPAWRRLVHPVDRGLLLALAERVGPATFERPNRSWAYEELSGLYLPSAAAATAHRTDEAAGAAASGDAALQHGSIAAGALAAPAAALLALPAGTAGAGSKTKRYQLASIRLYPGVEGGAAAAAGAGGSSPSARDAGPSAPDLCEDCRARLADKAAQARNGAAEMPAPWWDGRASVEEAAGIWAEEFSLVLSVLEEEAVDSGAVAASAVKAEALEQSASQCEPALRELWRCMRRPGGGGGARARQLLRQGLLNCEPLTAAVLFDEFSHDALAVPSPCHCCAALPWQCFGRLRRATALRRIHYWLHALPPLTETRTQQYVCCEGYTVAGMRRDDGIHCWAVMDNVKAASPTQKAQQDQQQQQPRGPSDSGDHGRALAALSEVLRQLPRVSDLRLVFEAS